MMLQRDKGSYEQLRYNYDTYEWYIVGTRVEILMNDKY